MIRIILALAFTAAFGSLAAAQDFQAGSRSTSVSGTAGSVFSGSATVGPGVALGGAAFLGGGFANAFGAVGIAPGPTLVATSGSNNLAGAGVIDGGVSSGQGVTVQGGTASSVAAGVGQSGWAFAFPGPIPNPPLGPSPVIGPITIPVLP
jgi:hypothetical protein